MQNLILIVDDDHDLRETFAAALRLVGHQVETASNGQVALERLAASDPPCLILLDIMMPVMNGEEFRRQQMADPRLCEIPVVIVTAGRDAEQKALELGVAGALPKPVDFYALANLANRYCPSAQPAV